MRRLKKIWFLALLLLLFLPMLQRWGHWVEEKPLDGAFVPTPKPVVTLKTLYQETVQDSLMAYCTEQSGFRNTMIRLNNQLLYSAFGKISALGPVKGSDGKTFFEESYIISYTGETYIGEEKVQKTAEQIKLIQDMLQAKGVRLLPVFALGKASYFPERIPRRYLDKANATNNYQEYLKAFAGQEVEYIDFNRYFCDRKEQFPHPLYCDLSAHWTVYAASLAIDSLVRYMEAATGLTQAHAVIDSFDTNGLMNQDDDLYRMMNLLLPLPHNTIDNPHFSFTEGYRPKVLAIADSYWWTVWAWNVALPENLFSDGGFWFYNKTIYPERSPLQNVDAIDYKQEIENQEFVLLVCTEATNHLWPYGFIERYLSAYENGFPWKDPATYDTADSLYSTYRTASIQAVVERIKASPEWFESVKQQAEEQGRDLDDMLWGNAQYTYVTNLQPNGFVR